jgi:hypothetical protein
MMPLGPRRTWNKGPDFGDTDQNDWATWITNAMQSLQGTPIAAIPPQVATISHPGAVQIVWNEVNQATAYSVYETSTPNAPPGVPISTVAANKSAQANSMMRFNINDTVKRYYSVVTITQYGRSAPSVLVPGTALAVGATVIPISDKGVNINGVGGGVGGGGAIWSINQGARY